jgi:hypothetical protein
MEYRDPSTAFEVIAYYPGPKSAEAELRAIFGLFPVPKPQLGAYLTVLWA